MMTSVKIVLDAEEREVSNERARNLQLTKPVQCFLAHLLAPARSRRNFARSARRYEASESKPCRKKGKVKV